MDTKIASKIKWKHIIFCIIILIIFICAISNQVSAKEGSSGFSVAAETSDVVPLKINKIGILRNDVLTYLSKVQEETEKKSDYFYKYADDISFLAKAFGVNEESVITELKELNKEEVNSLNIGHLEDKNGNLLEYDNELYGLVEYFYNYVEKHSKEVSKKNVPYTGDANYVENLIMYYTQNIYTNVDTDVALSIGAAESGYYKVKYMLKCNNVFGGMSSKGLIKYKNIEYGVLSYVRMLSRKYYDKGLTTIKQIGRRYCPTVDNSGNKIASPHWIGLVNKAMKKYSSYEQVITVSNLVQEKENA